MSVETPEGQIETLHLCGATGRARTEMRDGKEYLVVPVVALMEGVIHPVNASTPEFVPFATMQRAANSWNGRPVTLGHPARDGRQCSANDPAIFESHVIGTIFNSRIENKKLMQEAWIEKAKGRKLHPEMMSQLEAHKTIEVSVGTFVFTDDHPGSFNGKRYQASWREAAGDHLAFLPGGRGACSCDMGCGTNRAAEMAPPMHLVTAESFTVMARKHTVECAACDGTGQLKADDKQMDCETCDGTGILLKAAAGARHSSGDMQMIQTMHDHAVSLGASCGDAKVLAAVEPLIGDKPERIRREGGKYALYSLDGLRKLAEHDSLQEAQEHDEAIKSALVRREA